MTVNIHHQLLGPQDTISFKDVDDLELTDEQKLAIKKALTDLRFLMSNTYREQVFRLCSLLHGPEEDGGPIVSYDTIGSLFAQPRTHGAITDEFRKSLFEPNAPHRPFILLEDEIQLIKEELERTKDDYPTIDDITFFIMENFNKCPSRSTVKRAIKDRIQGFKIVKVKGIEDNRYDCKFDDIKDFYQRLAQEVKGVPVGFLFNLDESGQNQYIDARNIYVIVPENANVITYPLNRNIKRITLLHCIGTDGSSCDPLIILPRLTLDNEIFDIIPTGLVMFASQKKGYCTHEIFSNWFIDKFIPYLIAQQDRYHYYGKSVIIMDGFTGHDKSLQTLDNVLKQFNIKILFIPAHSSDQVQPLDLFGFNIQKLKTSKYIFNHHYSMQTNQILAILDGLNEISSFKSITTAFNMAGIFRTRNEDHESANGVFKQEHIIDMDRNTKIRRTNMIKEALRGRTNRLKKYEVLKPDENYPKRKELKLLTPLEYTMNEMTCEEAKNLRRKYSIRRYPQDQIEDPKNHKITEYSILKFKATKRKPSTKKKRVNHRVAVIRIPPNA